MEISMLDKILQPTDMQDKNGIAEEGLPTSKPSFQVLKRS